MIAGAAHLSSALLALALVMQGAVVAQTSAAPNAELKKRAQEALAQLDREALPSDCSAMPADAAISPPKTLDWAATRCTRTGHNLATNDLYVFGFSVLGLINELPSSRCEEAAAVTPSYITAFDVDTNLDPKELRNIFVEDRVIEQLSRFERVDRVTVRRKNGCVDLYVSATRNDGTRIVLIPIREKRGGGALPVMILERAKLLEEKR